MQHFGVFQPQRIDIAGELRARVIPEHQLAHVPGKLRVQLVRYLFQVQFRHSSTALEFDKVLGRRFYLSAVKIASFFPSGPVCTFS